MTSFPHSEWDDIDLCLPVAAWAQEEATIKREITILTVTRKNNRAAGDESRKAKAAVRQGQPVPLGQAAEFLIRLPAGFEQSPPHPIATFVGIQYGLAATGDAQYDKVFQLRQVPGILFAVESPTNETYSKPSVGSGLCFGASRFAPLTLIPPATKS